MKLNFSKPKCLWNIKTSLGEGITWVNSSKNIYFVDIYDNKLFSYNISTNKKKKFKFKKKICFIFQKKKNLFLCGFEKEISFYDLKKKIFFKTIKVEENIKSNRINDGCIDNKGNLWFGTMDKFEKSNKGSLYCLDRHFNLTKVDTKYTVPNGPIFENNTTMYHTDSAKRIIYKIKISNNFKIISKKIFVKFEKKDGYPDGMTLDCKGNLWVCKFKGFGISIYNKKSKNIGNISIPAKNVTKCVFGGENNRDLFIITARVKNNKKELQKYKFSGGLFKVKTNIKGKLENKLKHKND